MHARRGRGWPPPAPPRGTDPQSILRSGTSSKTRTSTSDLCSDLESSVSANKQEFVAGILHVNNSAMHIHQSALRSRWRHTARQVAAPQAMPSTAHSGCSHKDFLPSPCLLWHEKQLRPYFPSQRIERVTRHKSGTENGKSYFKLTASTPHPFASFTSRSLWHCHPMDQRHIDE